MAERYFNDSYEMKQIWISVQNEVGPLLEKRKEIANEVRMTINSF